MNSSFLHALGLRALLPMALLGAHAGAYAQNLVISDNFIGASASMNWIVFDGACLTAGNGTGAIPACSGNPYYNGVRLAGGQTGSLPDPVGGGALRLTNNSNQEKGGIISNFTFPSSSGVAVTFSTITYAGNGADGMSFFLTDGSVKPIALGVPGGGLGYVCTGGGATPPDGLQGAYLGLGLDELGNFMTTGAGWGIGVDGIGFRHNSISLRGAGDVNWPGLNATYPAYYPSSLSAADRLTAVRTTCRDHTIYDFSGDPNKPIAKSTIAYNYNVISGGLAMLPASTPIATSASTRPTAKPITYQLKITHDKLLSLAYSYNGGTFQPVLTDQSIAASNGPLPSTFRFGFAGSTGGANNIHEITCFKAVPATQSASGAGVNTSPDKEVRTGTQLYLAGYESTNWSGQLTSQDLLYNPVTGLVKINSFANWDGSCQLTGGSCATTGGNTPLQAPNARTMLTWSGTAGIPFQYASLSAAQKATINLGDSTQNGDRTAFLRGDRSNETAGGGTRQFRERKKVLGDIIDSGPAWLGPPVAPYGDTWIDGINASASPPENSPAAQKYSAFLVSAKTRLNVVYVGANDGFVHGFRTGAYDASGTYLDNASYPNDGREVLAYMPAAVFANIHSTTPALDYAHPKYSHAYGVNAVPYIGDLFYDGAWHSWLVGGLGAGGKGIYALDVTDPSQFSERNAAQIVKTDLTAASIVCANVPACGSYLGNTHGTPQIRRFHNGHWGFVFGNGLESTNGVAGIYVLTIDPTTQVQTVHFLSTGSGGASAGANNGITSVTAADLDADHIVDYVYAGDIKGNMWRFDLLAATPSSWAVSEFGTGAAAPLYAAGVTQPISTRPVVANVPGKTGYPRVMVDFGTGNKTPQTLSSAAAYATAAQSLYGIWDWDMTHWNSKAADGSLRASLAGPVTIALGNLQPQVISTISGATDYRTVTSNPVCWTGSTECSTGNTKNGWYINLPGVSEQLVYDPVFFRGVLTLSSTLPARNTALNCASAADTAGILSISPSTGGSFRQSSFADVHGNFVNYGGAVVSGVLTTGVGSPSFVTAGGNTFLLQQTSDGTGLVLKYNPAGGNSGSRLTWQEIR